MLEQYEALRRQALAPAQARGLGLSLFVARGMIAWLEALTALSPRSAERGAIPAGPPRSGAPDPPPLARWDLVALMADMVLACSAEDGR